MRTTRFPCIKPGKKNKVYIFLVYPDTFGLDWRHVHKTLAAVSVYSHRVSQHTLDSRFSVCGYTYESPLIYAVYRGMRAGDCRWTPVVGILLTAGARVSDYAITGKVPLKMLLLCIKYTCRLSDYTYGIRSAIAQYAITHLKVMLTLGFCVREIDRQFLFFYDGTSSYPVLHSLLYSMQSPQIRRRFSCSC